MRTLPLIRSLLVASLAVGGFTSCVGIDGGYGYGGSYYDDGPYYGGPASYGYGNSYYYSGGRRYYHDHDDHDHGHSHNHGSSNDDKIKLVRGSDGDHPRRPQGYHSVDWYQKKGYDLKDYTHKHQDSGDVHKGSKSSSSSSHKSNDDDKHKGHKH